MNKVIYNKSKYFSLLLLVSGPYLFCQNSIDQDSQLNKYRTSILNCVKQNKKVKNDKLNVDLVLDQENIDSLSPNKKYAYLNKDFLNNLDFLSKNLPEIKLSESLEAIDTAIKNGKSIVEFHIAKQAVKDIKLLLLDNLDNINKNIYDEIKTGNDKYAKELKSNSATVKVKDIDSSKDLGNSKDKFKIKRKRNIYSRLLVQDLLRVQNVLLSSGNTQLQGELTVEQTSKLNGPVFMNFKSDNPDDNYSLTVIGNTNLDFANINKLNAKNAYIENLTAPNFDCHNTQDKFVAKKGSDDNPSFSFKDNENTGIYSEKKNEVNVTSGGNKVAEFNSNGLNVTRGNIKSNGNIEGKDIKSTGKFVAKNKGKNNPTYAFRSPSPTGISANSSNVISISSNGTSIATFDGSNGLSVEENATFDKNIYIPDTDGNGSVGIIYKKSSAGNSTPVPFLHNYGSSTNLFVGENSGTNSGTFPLSFTGTNNIAIGADTGSNLSSTDSNNIYIGGNGSTSESNTIRIGNGSQSACYVAGVKGAELSSSNSPKQVYVNEQGQLGVYSSAAGTFYADDGTASQPSYTFTSDNNTGIYYSAPSSAPEVDIAVSSSKIASFDSGGLTITGSINSDSITSTGNITGGSITSTGIITAAGNVTSTGGKFIANNGGSAPVYTFNNDTSTGIYSSATEKIDIAVGSSSPNLALFDTSGLIVNGKIEGNNITASNNIQSNSLNVTNAITSGPITSSDTIKGNNIQTDKNLYIPQTSDNNTGIIYKGSLGGSPVPFIHNYGNSNNTFIGENAGTITNFGGNNNIAIGANAGSTLSGEYHNNIYIGNEGIAGDMSIIRIGDNNISECYLAGISGKDISNGNGSNAVFINSEGQLGTNVSSRIFKEDINDLNIDSKDIKKLRPVSFKYKKDKSKTNEYGLIAEEVKEIFPELVTYNKDGQLQSVKYYLLPTILLHEIQKQNKYISKLSDRIVKLENKR